MNAQEEALLSWAVEPVPALGLIAAAVVYLRGWWILRRAVPGRYPVWRAVCFVGGLAALGVSLFSPLDAFASFLLLAHMAQHLLLTMVAPPLLLLGAPQLPMLRGLPRVVASRGLAPFINWPPLQAAIHAILHPAVCWSLFIVSNVVWHVPELYELALRSRGWHEVEHAMFFCTAMLFWWHVVQPWPSRARWPRWAMIPYLLLADLQNTALAAFLSFHEGVLYPTYAAAPRLLELSAAEDQAGAGALMWVPGSIAFLLPAGFIALKLLMPQRGVRPGFLPPPQKAAPKPKPVRAASGPLDLFRVPVLGSILRWHPLRPLLQITMLALAVVVVLDGFFGPEVSAMNAAGVLPWTHWRTFSVVGLLIVGNVFCMACPFVFVRDLGRKIFPARLAWPRVLRTKWLAVGLIVGYLFLYEAFDLWDWPLATAVIILGYFAAAMVVDGVFRGASFCQFVCPIGQFHFVQSLASPFEIRVREPAACASCKTHDCLRGNESQRGCELHLFQPRKHGNMDCTFCLDCVKACPHDNVGLIAVPPGHDVANDPKKSTVGTYARRPDIAALVLVLTFGAFANAAGMVTPVLNLVDGLVERYGLSSNLMPLAFLALLTLVILPGVLSGLAAAVSSGGKHWRENLCRFAPALAPLGFGMWLAHFLFHFFTAALTPVPVASRLLVETGLREGEVQWAVPSWAFQDLPALEIVFLNAGCLLCLYLLWRIAGTSFHKWRAFLPWATLALMLYLAGIWIIFQPMEMRGTLMH